MFVDGVPAISNEGDKFYHGGFTGFRINNSGTNYQNPTVLVNESTRYGVDPNSEWW